MRNQHQRSAALASAEGGKDLLAGFCVQGRKRVVNDQNRPVSQQGAGQGDTLLLTAREPQAFFTDPSLITV